ncbi:MAG TPA: hypothetical protein VGC07_03790 [Granulicella sp.]
MREAYSIREVAERMGYSYATVRKLFEAEPDVLVIGHPTTKQKRRYRSIRIPHRVFERVLRRLSN